MSSFKFPSLILAVSSWLIFLGYTCPSYAAEQIPLPKETTSLTLNEPPKNIDRITALESHIQSLNDQISKISDALIKRNKEIDILKARNMMLNDFSYDSNKHNKLSEKIAQHDSDLRGTTIGLWSVILSTITLFIAILAFVGFGGITYLRNKIDEMINNQVKKILDSKALMVQMNITNESGYDHFENYSESGDKLQLNAAIRHSKWALNTAKKFEANTLSADETAEWLLLCGQIKNNLSYYIAESSKPSKEEKKEAIKLAEDVYNMSNKNINGMSANKKANWQESYAFVKYKLGDEHQKADACKVIKTLTTDPHLPSDWREALKKEWIRKCPDIGA